MATGKNALLQWCKQCTEGYKHVNITNFHMSWADGMAFCALIHAHRPELIPYSSLDPKNKEKNMELAFSTATKLGIPPLLDVEDMFICAKPEQFSIMTYLSQFYHFFKTGNAKASGLGTIKIESTVPSSSGGASQTAKRPAPVTGRTDSPVTSPPAKKAKMDETHPCCAKCAKPLSGNTVEAPGGMYHEACFGCFKCGKKLNRCLNVENKPYCDTCGRAALLATKKASMSSAKMKNAAAASAVVSAAAGKSKWQQERDERERQEKERQERYLREKQEKEKADREKREREQQEREAKKKEEERLKRERDERERKDREERERKDRERKDREERERKDREDRERREREARERREREDRERREREQREREQREKDQQKQTTLREKEKAAREERERKERERKEREEQERKDRLDRERREREEKKAREDQQRADRERNEREERERRELDRKNAEKEKNSLQERERKLEQERLEAQRIEDERKAKAAAASGTSTKAPPSNDGGQSEWLQKVNQLNKKREEKRSTYIQESVPSPSPAVDRSKKEIPQDKFAPTSSPAVDRSKKFEKSQDKFAPASPVHTVHTSATKPAEPADDIDIEVSEDEIAMAQADVVVFNFEERVSKLEGFLYQKQKKRKWVKRWFMVNNGRLTSYSAKPESSSAETSQKQLSRNLSQDVFIIPLDTVEEIRPTAGDDQCFSIKTDKQVLHLRCTDVDDVGIWISGLYHHINTLLRDPLKHEASETRQAPVIQEGILQQRKKNSWKKYWFCLRNGFISCYLTRHRNSTTKRPQYKLALFDCQIEEYEPEKNNYAAFQITTQTGEQIILLADNAENMLFWINAILKEKFLIEETINNISIS